MEVTELVPASGFVFPNGRNPKEFFYCLILRMEAAVLRMMKTTSAIDAVLKLG